MFEVITESKIEDIKKRALPAFPQLIEKKIMRFIHANSSEFSGLLNMGIVPGAEILKQILATPAYIWKSVVTRVTNLLPYSWRSPKTLNYPPVTLDFEKLTFKQKANIPAYIWKSFVGEVKNIHPTLWSSLKETNVHTLDFSFYNIAPPDVGFSMEMAKSSIQLIRDDNVIYLALKLQGTKIHIVNLSGNKITQTTQQILQKLSSYSMDFLK